MRSRSSLFPAAALPLLLLIGGCQSPTTSSDTLDVDDFVDATVAPGHAIAQTATDGRTYRVVRGNNQPDEVLTYDWVTSFSITLTLNSNATHKDIDVQFPVTITSVTGKVQQATGGIVSPPSSGEIERYESVLAQSSGSTIHAVDGLVTLTFQVWYDLPSLKREALINESVTFKDADGVTFVKSIDVIVDP